MCSSDLLGFDALTPVVGVAPASRSTGRTDHDIAHDFLLDMRGAPPPPQEASLLRLAVDACCDDPLVDTLFSLEEAGG